MRPSTPFPRFPKPGPGNLPGIGIEPRANESAGELVRRFTRLVHHSGVLGDLGRHRYASTPGQSRSIKRQINERRKRKRQRQRRERQERRRVR